MSKFGKKFTCWKCATKFYDLNKPGAKCPKCGANPDEDPNRGMPAAPAAAAADDFADDDVEEIPEDVGEEEDGDDEAPEDEAPDAGDDL
jgi:uncharacterized protein (TIGR02300 family)